MSDELDELARRRRARAPGRLRIVEPPLPMFGPAAAVERLLVAVEEADPSDDRLDVEPELVRQVEELPLGWGEEPDR